MKLFKMVLSVFLGTLVYSTLSICIGPRSLWAMDQLSVERNKIAANLNSLYLLNEDLDSHFQNLSADAYTISVYAHELGYIAKDEKLIKLAGFNGGIDRSFESGSALTVRNPVFLPEWTCKFFGFASGAFAFFFITYLYGLKKNKQGGR
jgi:hypothetical protein